MLDITRISDATTLCSLIQAVESGPDSAAVSLALGRLPWSQYLFTTTPNSALLPPHCLAVSSDTVLVCVSGISSISQGASYYLASSLPPVPCGSGGCNGYALLAARAIIAQLQVFTPVGSRRVVLVGYSFGGALLAVMASILRAIGIYSDVQLLTFGAPRPGDAVLAASLDLVTVRRLFTPSDPIPRFPPSILEAPVGVLAAGFATAANWSLYTQPGGGLQLESDGGINAQGQPAYAVPLTEAILLAVASGRATSIGQPHALTTYLARMTLAAAAAVPPNSGLPAGHSVGPVSALTATTFNEIAAAAAVAASGQLRKGADVSYIPIAFRPKAVRLDKSLWAVVWMGEPVIECETQSSAKTIAKYLHKFLREMQNANVGASLAELQSSLASYFVGATSPTAGFNPILPAL